MMILGIELVGILNIRASSNMTRRMRFVLLNCGSSLSPSYVYHVHAKNFTGFLEAVKSAISTPIDRYGMLDVSIMCPVVDAFFYLGSYQSI
jgi:hypothetical protein